MADVTASLVSGASTLSATVETPRIISGQLQSGSSGLSATVTVATPDFRLNIGLKSGPSGLATSAGRIWNLSLTLKSGPSGLDWNGGIPERYRGGDIGSHTDLNIALNRNFQKIANALSGAISRTETRPMMDELDMNSHRITGVRSMLNPGCPWAGPLDLSELNNLVTLAGLEDPESLTFCVTRASVQEVVQAPYYAPGWCETYRITSKLYPLYVEDAVQAGVGLLDGKMWTILPEEVMVGTALLASELRDPLVVYQHPSEDVEVGAGVLPSVLRSPLVSYDHRSEPETVETSVGVLSGTLAMVLVTYDHTTNPEKVEAAVAILTSTLT